MSLLEGVFKAFSLILTLDPNLIRIVLLSLQVSLLAVVFATLAGVPLGAYLGLKPPERTRFVSKLLYTLMGLPPVVAGLVIYLLISRMGPLGVLGLLYTPTAMIMAQFALAVPIIAALTMIGIRSRGKEVQETARTLGADRILIAWTVVRESRFAIFGAVVTGLGRVIAEVGAVMIVGGNIEGHTRVMTTAIVLETGKGNFELALGLGLILLLISFAINSLLYYFREAKSLPGKEIILEVKNLSKVYEKEVLHIDQLSIRKGRIYGIIGPSGAGKSTLLRLVNMLEPPTGGEVYFQGRPISINVNGRADVARREMTLVFQKPLLFGTSVEENVAFGLKARRFAREEIRERVDILLGKVGLREFARRHAATLSGGEAQRVALARAVAFEPALLLLDEPTANLDPSNVELIERLIMDLNRETAMTIIMVTHNIFQARRIAQEVIFMHEGRIIEAGETEKVFTSPEDSRTRAFVEGLMVY